MANLGVQLVNIYEAYVNGGGQRAGASNPNSRRIEFQNGEVGLQLKSLGGDFSQYRQPAHRRRA